MRREGVLLILSGPSGVGKGTICREFIKKNPNCFLSVSVTSRTPRPGEIDGEHYHFISTERFEEMIANNELLEYAQYLNCYYGTPIAPILENIKLGKDIILEIEVVGGLKVKQKQQTAVMVFVAPPSMDILKKRLSGRGTESKEVVDKRIAKAMQELEQMDAYDYIIINDDLDAAVDNLSALFEAEHCAVSRSVDYIRKMLFNNNEE